MGPIKNLGSTGADSPIPPAVSLIAGDMLNPYLTAALESMPESRVMEIIRSAGVKWDGDLEGFRKTLRSEVHFPNALFQNIGARLIDAGMVQERAMFHSHTRKISLRSVTKMNLVLMTELAQQEIGREMLDMVSISLLRAGVYDPMFCNSICSDGALEKKQGNLRKARYIVALLHPDVISWFWYNHAKWLAVYAPTNMGEPKAEAKIITGDDFFFSDPTKPDHPLRLSGIPSLRQVAGRHGQEMTVAEEMVSFNGQIVAVRDHCPGRVMDGLYRMIQDVRLENGQVMIEKTKSVVRPYHSRLLYQGHRYHLEQSLPIFEIEMDYTVHRIRQAAFSGALVLSRKLWTFFTGSDVNPWRGLLKLTERRDAVGVEREIDAHFLRNSQPAQEIPASLPLRHKVAYYKSKFYLTDRETQVLVCLVEGKSNKEIAAELAISELTVKSHVSNILSKTGFQNRNKLNAAFSQSEAIKD